MIQIRGQKIRANEVEGIIMKHQNRAAFYVIAPYLGRNTPALILKVVKFTYLTQLKK